MDQTQQGPTGHNDGNGGQNPKSDKLDRWIEQNVHIDKPSFPQAAKPSVSQPRTQAVVHHHHQAAVRQPRPQVAAPFPHIQKTPVAQANPAKTGSPVPHAHKHQPQRTNQPNRPNRPVGKFGRFFNRPDRSPAKVNNNVAVRPQPLKEAKQPIPAHFHGKLRIIPLGGLDEVGKNCMILEYMHDIILIDVGFQFPEEDMLGVDYVIPDITYLEDKLDRVKGIVITHGHLDHIGALPYLLPKLNFPPVYGTKLTIGLINKRLEEFGLEKQTKVHVITAEDTLQLGHFNVSFFRVNHSIPDSVGIVVKTPAGNIVHTGDFKFDFTPSGGQKPADFNRIASLSNQNIAALFIDSTNALKNGYTISEQKVGESMETIIKNHEGRIVIASFSSQIGRLQQIVDVAKKYHRTIFLSGRSLIDNVYIASKLGYLKIPPGLVHDIRKVHKLPENKILILTTGSQGEPVSALTRMAMEDHASVKIKKGDVVVLSSSPIPGNERAISTVMNNLSRLGAQIINNQIMDVHTSGHAQREDLKLMMNLVKAKAIVPIHGEYYMRYGNKEIAMGLGYAEKDAILIENGGVIEIENGQARATGESVETKYILIDGLGVGDVGAQVIMDRQTLAENGVLIVIIPVDQKTQKLKGQVDIISRGFIYMKEAEELISAITAVAENAYRNILEKRKDPKRAEIKKYLKESIDKYVHQKIERHPLILPVIVEK